MRSVVICSGIIATRESAAMIWYPENRETAGSKLLNGRERREARIRTLGRYIHVWAEEAGFGRANIKKSTGPWCLSSPEERKYWGGSMGESVRSSGLAKTADEEGYAVLNDELVREVLRKDAAMPPQQILVVKNFFTWPVSDPLEDE